MNLFCFGMGYSALHLATELISRGWRVSGTCRQTSGKAKIEAINSKAFLFDRNTRLPANVLQGTTHLLISIPPDELGDPVLDIYGDEIASIEGLSWIGYLSTTGVYGDTGGLRVDENYPPSPTSVRGCRRVAAEKGWIALYSKYGLPTHIFRLAGIYGPGRSAIEKVLSGTARRIDFPGHKFSRIHIDDIINVLMKSMVCQSPGKIYNVCDDVAAYSEKVVEFACKLLGVGVPPLIPYSEAEKTMSAMARSFWQDRRLVDNSRIKVELGINLRHSDFRSGLRAIYTNKVSGSLGFKNTS